MNDEAWHAWRREGIGGSDIPALLGLSKWGSPYSVWCDKRGTSAPSDVSEQMWMGLDLESAIAKMFERHTGLFVGGSQMWVDDPSAPWRRCTLDGAAFDHPEIDDLSVDDLIDALGPVQMKSAPGAYGWPDGPPSAYVAQVRWEMGCTGHDKGWLAVLFKGLNFEVFPVDQDPVQLAHMRDVADTFWWDNVIAGLPPEVDGSDATRIALLDTYPDAVPDAAVEVPLTLIEEWKLHRDGRLALEAEAKQARSLQNEVENRLLALLGDAAVATVDGVPALTCRTSARAGYTVEGGSSRSFRLPTKKDLGAA